MPASISVVLPAYNSQGTLAAALDSVFAQTRPPDEVIVVDDGSKDATPAIVSNHPQATRIRYLRQENTGAAAARNAGIRAATGEWIAFLDADDLWLPRRLEAGREVADRNPELRWIAGTYWERTRGGQDLLRGPSSRALTLLKNGSYFPDIFDVFHRDALFWTSTFLIHRSCIAEVGGFDPSFVRREDVDLWLRIGLRHPQVGYVREPIAIYQRHGASLTYQTSELSLLFMLRHLQRRGSEVEGGLKRISPYGRWLTAQACESWLHTGDRTDLRAALDEMPAWIPAKRRPALVFAARLPSPAYQALSAMLRYRLRLLGRRSWPAQDAA
jgi:glycosyltransferase involved in cell wall biosynthesis